MLNAEQNPEAALRELVERVQEMDDPEGSPSIPKGLACRLIVQAIQATRRIARATGDYWSTESVRRRADDTLRGAVLDLEKEADPISRA